MSSIVTVLSQKSQTEIVIFVCVKAYMAVRAIGPVRCFCVNTGKVNELLVVTLNNFNYCSVTQGGPS
jgi:hypothetical protein